MWKKEQRRRFYEKLKNSNSLKKTMIARICFLSGLITKTFGRRKNVLWALNYTIRCTLWFFWSKNCQLTRKFRTTGYTRCWTSQPRRGFCNRVNQTIFPQMHKFTQITSRRLWTILNATKMRRFCQFSFSLVMELLWMDAKLHSSTNLTKKINTTK